MRRVNNACCNRGPWKTHQQTLHSNCSAALARALVLRDRRLGLSRPLGPLRPPPSPLKHLQPAHTAATLTYCYQLVSDYSYWKTTHCTRTLLLFGFLQLYQSTSTQSVGCGCVGISGCLVSAWRRTASLQLVLISLHINHYPNITDSRFTCNLIISVLPLWKLCFRAIHLVRGVRTISTLSYNIICCVRVKFFLPSSIQRELYHVDLSGSFVCELRAWFFFFFIMATSHYIRPLSYGNSFALTSRNLCKLINQNIQLNKLFKLQNFNDIQWIK